MVNISSMTKKRFCVKKIFFAKSLYFLKKKMSQQILLGLIQALNMSKHISRNRGATIKASRKIVHGKVFLNFGTNRPFFSPKNGGTIQKKL